MGWLAVGVLSLAAFLIAAFVLRLPREGWTLFAAALVFGLAGYAWQGSPELPAAPKSAEKPASRSGEPMVNARLALFDQTLQKPGYLITSDAFARQGQFDTAAGMLRKGLDNNPDHVEGWMALGMALVAHADGFVTPPARYAYDRAAAINPANPIPRFALGDAYWRAQDFREARKVWADLLADSPEDAPWREDLTQRIKALDEMIANAPFAQGQ